MDEVDQKELLALIALITQARVHADDLGIRSARIDAGVAVVVNELMRHVRRSERPVSDRRVATIDLGQPTSIN